MAAPHPPIVNIVVTCSNRKSAEATSTLLVRNLPQGSCRVRSEEWIKRLTTWTGGLFPAIDLYQGDHWTIVRSLVGAEKRLTGWSVNVWIASAGCGLISPRTLIPAYGATFSGRNPDSVVLRSESRREWWRSLAELRWNDNEFPNSVSAIATLYPDAPLLVTASPDYLDAIADDLLRARDLLSDSQGMSVLCRQGALYGQLEECKVHVSADLSSRLGGALTSLNARLVKWLITDGPTSLSFPEVHRTVEALRQQSAPRQIPIRLKATDEEIKAYIYSQLRWNGQLSGSAALSAFRFDGKAAEQSRFHRLFRAAREEVAIG